VNPPSQDCANGFLLVKVVSDFLSYDMTTGTTAPFTDSLDISFDTFVWSMNSAYLLAQASTNAVTSLYAIAISFPANSSVLEVH
jgi:hypothetical protein